MIISAVLPFVLAPVALWPLERQDRYGTAQALSGLSAGEYSTPWREFELAGNFIASHGPSLGADGKGYFGLWVNNTVRKFDIATGAILGTFAAGNFVVCTPAIGNGRIFVSTDNPAGKVFGVDSSNMFADWVEPTGYVSGSPNLGPEGDVVYTRLSGEVTRRDAATGASVWSRTGYTDPRGTAAFTRDDQMVVVSHGTSVTAFRWSDGVPQWTYSTTTRTGAPAVAPDGTVVFGTDGGKMIALTPAGAFKWQRIAAAEIRAAPAFGIAGEVYFGSYDFALYAIDVASGTPLWSYFTSLWVNSSPSVGHDGRIYFHNRNGDLYCLAPNGTLIWTKRVGVESRGPMSIGEKSTLFLPYQTSSAGGLVTIRQDAPTLAFLLSSLNPGITVIGSPADLLAEDGQYYALQTGASAPSNARIDAIFDAQAPKEQLDQFTVSIATKVSTATARIQTQLYNYATGQWVVRGLNNVLPGTLVRLTLVTTTGASQYVQPGTRKMRVRLTYTKTSLPSVQWSALIDRLSTRVVPTF